MLNIKSFIMGNTRKVAFYTLGCKLNFAETSTIERLFIENGFKKAEFDERTEVIVINTCTVTASADKKCRNIISKASRNSPGAFIVVVGCYSQIKSAEIAKIPGVDLVLGSNEKFQIFDYAGDFTKHDAPSVYACGINDIDRFTSSYSLGGRTRSFLKIQDGCDYFCSYCTIPLARGRSRSTSVEEIVRQAREIEAGGIKEVVLTGVNIGDFGKARDSSLFKLLKELEKKTGIERYRLSSIEPDLLSDEIIEFMSESRVFAPHFHLPLQSGCNRILEKMNRRYQRSLFTDRTMKIREMIPGAGTGADVIAGFPGETAADFDDTADFVKDADIAFLHVFSYSDRSSTKASRLPDKVSPAEKERRSKVLHSIAKDKLKVFQERSVGQVHQVLFETINKKGRMSGFTGNYLRVEVPANNEIKNRIVNVKLVGVGEDGVMKGFVQE